MIYFTSDTHFGHKNIIKYENRPYETIEEMDEDIIKKWNERITDNDTIYILGDFSWHNAEKTTEILKQLNGNKILIVGNHDAYINKKDFNNKLFDEITPYKEIKYNGKFYILSHFPIAEWNGKLNGSIHLFGHLHTMDNEAQRFMNNQPNCLNVGWDVWKKVMPLDELLPIIQIRNMEV